jgi:hypothetical protein
MKRDIQSCTRTRYVSQEVRFTKINSGGEKRASDVHGREPGSNVLGPDKATAMA